jgi:hypothetical protein
MSAVQGVGDGHPGQWLPFWDRVCAEGRPRACAYLASLQSIYCDAGSGWACNEAGILEQQGGPSGPNLPREDRARVTAWFERGCRLGFVPACRNAIRPAHDARPLERPAPALVDYPIVLRGSKGPIPERTAPELYARACEQGWPDACGRAPR